MANEVMDPATGEVVDLAAMTDRALLEAVYRQQSVILGALLDVLGAAEANGKAMDEMLQAAKGPEKKGGKNPVAELREAIEGLIGAVREVPEQTAEAVDGRLEDTIRRSIGAE
ncbi:hypothetical protein [Paracraurococcus lichenis]|uniref:Uncharacterized protein n=1 Tax=Paracraurococcus lichenis TaxID=3064888 RepID=A0ABT9EEM2_9PROT|nr:hypothetical protein [Paracraurococcus sp. LOR1-02]MDO9714661.1 hypothetical protein [Paracraurococcus sp. LOR1-02]